MKILNIYAVFFLFFSLCIFSQDKPDNPSWVYFERAENYKDKGDYSQAIIQANKSRNIHIRELLDKYYKQIKDKHPEKTEYELLKMVDQKKSDYFANDNYPKYHEIMGDLYVLTNFLEKAKKEYETALQQKKNFDYKEKTIEIKYKLAYIYNKFNEYEFEDTLYREIVKDYFEKKNKEYWQRIKINIAKDKSLNRVFTIYRIDAMIYLEALYKIGRRSAILQKKDDALFFLVNAAIVWMTHYSELIKKHYRTFQYENPTDFINFFLKKNIYEYPSEGYNFNEILFYIGYVYHLENNQKLQKYFFDLAITFSKGVSKETEMQDRVKYFYLHDSKYILSYEEILN